MIGVQASFDFDALAPGAPRSAGTVRRQTEDPAAMARAHWKVGIVTSLPLFCEIEGVGRRYTQMLPGVIETITGDLASVRIYAAPEYGSWVESCPLHRALAISVQLTELGKYHGNDDLQRLADEGRLATGSEQLAAEVRARHAAAMSGCVREIMEAA